MSMSRVGGILIVSVLFCAGVVCPAAAQAITARGGLDLTKVTFEEDATSLKPGLVGGAAFDVLDVAGGSLRVEGLFARRRVSFADGALVDRLTVLDVPATLRFGVYRSGSGRTAHVFGGGAVSTVLAASEASGGESFDITGALKRFTGGVVVGGDYEVTPKWSIDARYIFGLSGLYNALNGPATGKVRSIQLTVGYRIR